MRKQEINGDNNYYFKYLIVFDLYFNVIVN